MYGEDLPWITQREEGGYRWEYCLLCSTYASAGIGLVGLWWLPLGAVIVHAGGPSGAEPVAEVRGTPMGVDSPLSWVRGNPHTSDLLFGMWNRNWNSELGFSKNARDTGGCLFLLFCF